MVIHIGALKDKNYEFVYKDIKAVVDAAHPKAIVKVIIETSMLTDEEKVKACELAKKADADFVKTSTGFGEGGANSGNAVRRFKNKGLSKKPEKVKYIIG